MFTELDVSGLVKRLNGLGFSSRQLGKILGVSYRSVHYWANLVRKPRNPDRTLPIPLRLYEDNVFYGGLSNYEYSLNHNSPPNNHFSVKPSNPLKIKMFKRKIIFITDLLDTYNK
jgi:hypothetical protein